MNLIGLKGVHQAAEEAVFSTLLTLAQCGYYWSEFIQSKLFLFTDAMGMKIFYILAFARIVVIGNLKATLSIERLI